LNLLSGLYGRVTELRRAWYKRHPHRRRRLARPVISVGNLVVGGSGKTPVVAALATLLSSSGERPAILTRGYGRRLTADGVVVVSEGRGVLEAAARSGDEPQMLARALSDVAVLVSPNRYLAGRLAERRLGSTVHLLDDGFQHVQLERDIDLLVLSAADLEERLLPIGRLREPLRAARGADAVLISGTEEEAGAVAARLGGTTAFHLVARYGAPRLIHPFGSPWTGQGRRVLAVAGIGRPNRFFEVLRGEGFEVVREMGFRDHHWFGDRDLKSMQRAATASQADVIITTEKDAMRLLNTRPDALAPHVIVFLPMKISIEPRERFAAWLQERLALARARVPAEAA
jgi:tetraacyldisaccharide 4'-kinase